MTFRLMKDLPLRIALLAWVAILAPLLLAAQPEPAIFEATADARQVLRGSYFDVTFTLRNAQSEDFRPPAFEDFTVTAGPARSVRTSIINGRVTQETSWTYTLLPRRTGQLRIGPAAIDVDGRRLQTTPLNIEVLEGDAVVGGEEFFLRAEVNTTQAYVGQQIILDYKLYTTRDIEGINPLSESDYQGFYAREIRRFDSRMLREVINGREYYTRVLKRVALYPQQSGRLTISPLELMLGVVEEDESSRSFFLRRQLRQVPAATETLTFDVRPLPQPAPEGFSGAVGEYSFSTTISRPEATTDDALSLRFMLMGTGDLKRIQPPPLDLPPGFDVYDPKVLSEEYEETADLVQGYKEFEYLLVPQQAGRYTFSPALVYFDVNREQYVRLQDTTYALSIRPGTGAGRGAISYGDTTATDSTGQMRPFRTRVPLRRYTDEFFGTGVFWGLAAFPFLLVFLYGVLRRYQEREAAVDPADKRSRLARRVAERHLAKAQQHLRAGDSRAFYDEVARAMLGYVTDRLRIPTSELTKENVRQRLLELGGAPEQADRFVQILRNCELALYGGRDNEEAMQETYEDAARLLAEVEQVTR